MQTRTTEKCHLTFIKSTIKETITQSERKKLQLPYEELHFVRLQMMKLILIPQFCKS